MTTNQRIKKATEHMKKALEDLNEKRTALDSEYESAKLVVDKIDEEMAELDLRRAAAKERELKLYEKVCEVRDTLGAARPALEALEELEQELESF